jgi:hypothetical protein
MNIKDDAAMRGLILGKLYEGKENNRVLVKPEHFEPPIEMRDILRIGYEFKDAKLIKRGPTNMGNGIAMCISAIGQGVWEGQGHTVLDVSGLPSR